MLDDELSLKALDDQGLVADDGHGREKSDAQQEDDQGPEDSQFARLVPVHHAGEAVTRRRPGKRLPRPPITSIIADGTGATFDDGG